MLGWKQAIICQPEKLQANYCKCHSVLPPPLKSAGHWCNTGENLLRKLGYVRSICDTNNHYGILTGRFLNILQLNLVQWSLAITCIGTASDLV